MMRPKEAGSVFSASSRHRDQGRTSTRPSQVPETWKRLAKKLAGEIREIEVMYAPLISPQVTESKSGTRHAQTWVTTVLVTGGYVR